MQILFVCELNRGRSQMAEAFLRKLAPEIKVKSVGLSPAESGKKLKDANPRIVRFMGEIGYDVAGQKIKAITPEDVKSSDKIIVMTDAKLPDYLKDSYKSIYWSLKDFILEDDDSYRLLRDKIKVLVDELVEEIDSGN